MSHRTAAALALVCLLAACDKGAPAAPPATVLEYALGDFHFNGPDTIPAGPVALRFKLTGAEPHVMNFIRLDQDKRLADLMAAGEGAFDSAWVEISSGGMTITDGESPVYTFSLKPGRYVLLCYFHAADGVPHFAKGMVKEVIVAGPVTAAPPAAPVAQVDLVDFGYKLSAPIPSGTQTLRVLNPSGQGHEVIIKRLKAGVSLEEGKAWIARSEAAKGPSPWIAWGGVNMEPGDTVFMTADFPRGDYRLVCFYKLPGDSLNHAERGMDTFITVN
jgi:hypothetical protein